MPGSTIRYIAPPEPGLPGCFEHRPAGLSPAELAALPVVVMVHGISRNALEHVSLASRTDGLAARVLVAPLFEQAEFGQYQQLDTSRQGLRCDLALLALLDHLQKAGLSTGRFAMFGFSGGAQFAHRFALFHPDRLLALGLAAAGWYTMPNSGARWPFGLDTSRTNLPETRPAGLLDLPIQIMIGRGDRLRGKAVRTSPKLDAAQGRHRVERAQSFHQTLLAMAEAAGVPSRVHLQLLAADRHGFGNYSEAGQMLSLFADWLEQATPSPDPQTFSS